MNPCGWLSLVVLAFFLVLACFREPEVPALLALGTASLGFAVGLSVRRCNDDD